MLVTLSLIVLGCVPDAPDRFNGGGTHVDPPSETGVDSGGGGDDTATPDGWNIVGVDVGFEDLPNIGIAVFTFIDSDNVPSNLEGTRIYVTLDGNRVEIDGEPGVPVDNEYAWVTPDGEIFTALEVDGMGSYPISIYLETGSGERSTKWTGTVDSMNERDLPPKP